MEKVGEPRTDRLRGVACPGIKFKHSWLGLIDDSVAELRGAAAPNGERDAMPPDDSCRFVHSPPRDKCGLARGATLSRITVIVTEVKGSGSGNGNNLRVLRLRELQECALILHEIDSTCRHVFMIHTTTYVHAHSSRRTLRYAFILYSCDSRSV